ncbi:porin [Pantoea sp. 18069]|uniref:porin n=1 Tax=Pantoea sp. 18069 TaxID=2681415 RepID=UPI00135C9CC5|nr:porin [Pantoea sp. 18069]
MVRSKLAFAVILGAASCAVSAASKVEIYGVVDLGVAKGNGGQSANAGANGASDAWQVKQASASRWGFRGTEDLGAGLSMGFLLEHRFNPDTGTYPSQQPFFMQSTLGLSHQDIGTMWMGRDYMPAFWVAIKSDPFGADGVAQVGTANLYAVFSSASDNASRTNNSIGFKSKRFNGLSFDVAYGMHENQGRAQSGFNLQYQENKLYAGLGYAKKNNAVVANAAVNDELVNLGLIYCFEAFRVIGYVAQGKNKNFNTTSRQYMLGMDARLGPGRLKAAYSRLDSDYAFSERQKFGIGYDYNLSKLTRLYFDVGVGKKKNKSSNSAFAIGMRKAF